MGVAQTIIGRVMASDCGTELGKEPAQLLFHLC